MSYLEARWRAFAYNFGWADYVFLFDGWIARLAMAVPVVGYLILFNNSVSQHLSFGSLTGAKTAVAFGLTSSARLKLVYFGLIFLGSATIWYRLRRPFVLRIGTDQFEYVNNGLQNFTVATYININDAIQHEGHRTPHGKYYTSDYNAFLYLALGKDEWEQKKGATTANWTEAKSKYENLLRSMLIENFHRNNVKRRVSLVACIFLSLFGYQLLFVPSADLFIKVLAATFR